MSHPFFRTWGVSKRSKLIVFFGASLLAIGLFSWVFLHQQQADHADASKSLAVEPAPQDATSVSDDMANSHASKASDSDLPKIDPDAPRQHNSLGQALPFRSRTLPPDFTQKIVRAPLNSILKLDLFPNVVLNVRVLKHLEKNGNGAVSMALVNHPKQDYFFFTYSPGTGQGLVEVPSRNLAYEIRQSAGQPAEVREWLFSDRVCASPNPDEASAQRGLPKPSVRHDPEGERAIRGIDPADVPQLESRPGSPNVFYLDFDGETVTGTAWVNGGEIVAPAAEMTPNQVRLAWERVCRDFDPFDVNITTIPAVYAAASETNRITCIVTANDAAAVGAGGVAYLNSFTMPDSSGMKICWAFIDDDSKNTAEVISHELGHTLSLSHDGRVAFRGAAREEYYAGHGSGVTSWAPIMGVGYSRNLVQWSKGEYYRANNFEDDLEEIGKRLTYLAATHGGSLPTATPATNALTTGLIGEGLLLRDTNSEVFVISNFPAGLHTVELVPGHNGNVDARLEILNANGSTNKNLNPEDMLGAKSFFQQAATTNIYFRVSPAGRGQPVTNFGKTGYEDGYSRYGSLGQYQLYYRRLVEFSDTLSLTSPVGTRISRSIFTPYGIPGGDQLVSQTRGATTNRSTNVVQGATNVTITETLFLTNVYSNSLITLHPSLLRTNGLVLDPVTGLLVGSASTNFILHLSNNLTVAASNRTILRTNRLVLEHITVITNNGSATNLLRGSNSSVSSSSTSPPVLLTTFTNTNSLRLVFSRPAEGTFTNTPMGAFQTNRLPLTNSLGLSYGYRLLTTPASGLLTNDGGTNLLVSTSSLASMLEVSLRPTSPALEMWASNSRLFTVLKTNPTVGSFAFVTNPSLIPTTATNLRFGDATPLVVTNAGSSRVVFTVNSGGQVFFSNHPLNPNVKIPYLLATAGTRSSTVTATLAATATSAATSVDHVIQLTQAPSAVVMRGVLSNGAWTNINPALTTIPLQAMSTAGARVDFSTTNPHLMILNRNQLRMLAPGTGQVVATAVFQNTNNFVAASPVTNTVVVAWPMPATAPEFTSTNRRDGKVGELFTHLLLARSNTNAFPVTFRATNLPPGLAFDGTNRISGVPTQAGFFRMHLTASNAGGVATNVLTSAMAPSATFSVTQPWIFWVALGAGDDTNGIYRGTNLSTGIGTNVTNVSGIAPPVLILTNANTNPASGDWFAGLTNIEVLFSNSQSAVTSSVPLNVRPMVPALAWTGSVSAVLFQDLFSTGAVAPGRLTNLSGYPLSYWAVGLPRGLRINPTNGVISGRPLLAGRQPAQVWVSNTVGQSFADTVFDVAGVAGSSMEFSVKFTNIPGTYSVSYLPPGLALTPRAGLIWGNPQAVGDFDLVVGFVPSGATGTNYVTNRIRILPSAPLVRIPTNLVMARTGQPFLFQPWVTAAGWGWAGGDALTGSTISANWTNQLLAGTTPVVLSSNSHGVIRATTNGLTFTNTANPNELYLLWKSNLPSSWPWQAFLRLRIPGSITNTNGYLYPVLGAIRARASYPTNYLEDYADGGLLAETTNGVLPWSYYFSGNTTNQPASVLEAVGTNEVVVRFGFHTNGQILAIAVNTNPVTNAFVGLTTNTNLSADWSLTNPAAAFRLAIGSSFSNSSISSGQILLRGFSVLPQGVAFVASNLPAGLACDPESGLIHGTPVTPGTNTVSIRMAHPLGTNNTNFILRVAP